MRIVSLLPSATEIVCALGLADQLVGITHECDYPPEVRGTPVLTRSVLDDRELTSAEIDAAISALIRAGHSSGTIYHIDAEVLRAVQPDLILTQQLCEVCAVSFSEVQRAVAAVGGSCEVISLEPTGLEEILRTIALVGALAGVRERAASVIESLQARVATTVSRVGSRSTRPRVWCAEWLDPPFGAGHWVPEQVALAGGTEVAGRAGQPSQRMRWEQVFALAPEVVVLLPCGYDLASTLRESERTPPPPGWRDLPAVRSGQVYAVDGSAYFSRPGPRVVDGIEILAHILYPDRVPPPPPNRMARLEPGSSRWTRGPGSP
ncbi:MAG TPA: cobalamin-binding protein [Chloroflexota bacterium]|jgi:iron complex transport system substrate-binding protein|nr:cobalamin-binding protein [Chloroflexota bacterium]